MIYKWMMHLYSAFIVYCHTPKALYNHVGGGGSLLNHHQCAASTDATAATAQRRQCAHHTPATGGEEREIEPIKWMGIIRRPWLTRASGGKLARTPGLHPYSFTMSVMGFLMTTESQDLGLTSHPKDGAFYSIVSPSLYWGVRTHTDHRVSTPCWPH